MVEAVAQHVTSFKLEVRNLQTQLQMRPSVTKDLSFVSLVPKWAGTGKAVPLHEFLKL
jgi:hypothetical protein